MQVNGVPYRTIFPAEDGRGVLVIDQTKLPHRFEVVRLDTVADAVRAIATMIVRGAPLIGATAAYGMALAARENAGDAFLQEAHRALIAARPTAVNLRWAADRLRALMLALPRAEREGAAYREAAAVCEDDVAACASIGRHGAALIEKARTTGRPVNILTHCNAGWLAAVDWGTALAPIYCAHDAGVDLHVWVDETRPRNQGASLTAWELASHGVKHTLIADNAGGHLMQRGEIDLCIVGSDRIAANGDVCNKIGTYLKALAAQDNTVPFYVAFPHSTIDWTMASGADIPIEERDHAEVLEIAGLDAKGGVSSVRIAPPQTQAANPAFDVTPSRLVTALITERGVCAASREGLETLYPEAAARK
ncbi:MAG: S-methyl-5-thioribose-1-phosphate isomerase [Alphaproteobacteria bacterium]|nr:S-methyl-5-thioribose-1-phosphate isomerase [Alphaproteobacteria bacterium]